MVLSSQAECEARAEGKGMGGIGSIMARVEKKSLLWLPGPSWPSRQS